MHFKKKSLTDRGTSFGWCVRSKLTFEFHPIHMSIFNGWHFFRKFRDLSLESRVRTTYTFWKCIQVRHLSIGISIIFSLVYFSHFNRLFKNTQYWIFIPFFDELDNSKHFEPNFLLPLSENFSETSSIIWALRQTFWVVISPKLHFFP